MKRVTAMILALILAFGAFSVYSVSAAEQPVISFETNKALYVHAVLNSTDGEAWQAWQSEHDEDFNEVNPDVKYFFLPTSADEKRVDIYNGFESAVTVNGVEIQSGEAATVNYEVGTTYSVNVFGKKYALKFMKSNAEAAIYVNNTDADGNGTELMKYLNVDKERSASATGAVVSANGNIDNTTIKKIKGRGNTTWDKPKKAYNITYDGAVSVGGMSATKKFSILANYQDDSLSRNRFLYDLSDAVGMPYASDSRYVDFYANGYYWGSYQMTQKVDVGSSNLINDIDDEAYLNSDGTINEDFPFLCEVDSGATEGADYFVTSSSGNKLTIKAPELEPGDAGYDEVKAYVKSKFDAFYNSLKSTVSDPSVYADVDSLAKIYLINELGKNWDAGVSSLYFVYKQDSNGQYKFFASPVWDYDNSLGNAVGVESELDSIGVTDYEEYTGWWCMYKGRPSPRNCNNIMNYMSRNKTILSKAATVWFEEFVPSIEEFAQTDSSAPYTSSSSEMYRATDYYALLKGSAEMNYQCGWLVDTGSWICDHSSLKKAHYDVETNTYTVDSKATSYTQDFTGMYNYCVDWLVSRAAWMSSQMADDYVASERIMGDVDGDGILSIKDSTLIQKYAVNITYLVPSVIKCADVSGDSVVNIMDATEIQKKLAGLI